MATIIATLYSENSHNPATCGIWDLRSFFNSYDFWDIPARTYYPTQCKYSKLKHIGRLRMVQIPMFDVDDSLKYKTRLCFRYLHMGHGVT